MQKQIREVMKVCLLALVLTGGQVAAQTSSSPNYQTNEYMFGVGSGNSTSTNYQAENSVGSLGVGSSASASYLAEAGFLTPSEPFLEMVVTDTPVGFGELSDTTTSFGVAQGGGCNCSFNVRAYLSSEYVVYTISDPPTSENGDVLDAKSTQGSPITTTTVEEFGINLVDNTTPDLGANPVNVPDNNFADGIIETGYEVPDQFKYGVGDIIARSPGTPGDPAVGQTNYTITYMAKRANLSPAGLYQMDHVLVVVATY